MRSSETVSDGTVQWAARQVVRQHTEPPDDNRTTGSCAQCRDGDCDLLRWATVVVTAADLAHPRT